MTSLSSLQALAEHLSHASGRATPPQVQQQAQVAQLQQHAVYAFGGNPMIPLPRGATVQQVVAAPSAAFVGGYQYAQAVPVTFDSASGYYYTATPAPLGTLSAPPPPPPPPADAAIAAVSSQQQQQPAVSNVTDLIAKSLSSNKRASVASASHPSGSHTSVVADVPAMQSAHHHVPLSSKAEPSVSRSHASSPPPVHPPASLISVTSSIAPSAHRAPSVVSNLRDLDIRVVTKKVLGRVIVVGDVHGCPDQLRELAKTLQYDPKLDLMIIAGDLVNKGPDSEGAVRAVMELGAMAVVGNHDITVLEVAEQIRAKEIDPFSRRSLRDPAIRVARDMADECINFLKGLPHIIKIPQYNLIVLHAGMNLSFTLENQSIRDLTNLRRLEFNDEKKRFDSIMKGNQGTLWAKLYQGPELVVFGHDARTGLQEEPFAIGLDTGCVYGGPLTSIVFPGKKLVTVPGLVREKQLGADEDMDEPYVRENTPMQPSPAVSSFYDPVPMSNRSTPGVVMTPLPSVETSFPTVPQQLSKKQSLVSPQQPAGGISMQQSHSTDAISFLQSIQRQRSGVAPSESMDSAVSGNAMKKSASPQTPSPSVPLNIASQFAASPPQATVAPTKKVSFTAASVTATVEPVTSSIEEIQSVRSPAASSPSTSIEAVAAIQQTTVETLVKGGHLSAFLALLRTEPYLKYWEWCLQEDNASSVGMLSRTFWSDFIEAFVTSTDREKILCDEALELLEIVVEVLNDKHDVLTSKTLQRLKVFLSRVEMGDLKGPVPKGVLKSIKFAVQ